MMKVLLTGGNGQLGLELQKQLKENKNVSKVVSTDCDTLDIAELMQVREVLHEHKPDVVINCAAHTAVDKCEEDIENAYKINAIGPKNLAVVSE